MERQARFLLMGVFVLAFAAAIFASVYWLHGFRGLGATTVYMVRFEGGAPGVEVGASVLFDGVRVGEVATISFNPADPNEVLAKIVIDPKTPVRTDTVVGVDTAGLIGGGVVSLRGGGAASPAPISVDGAPPVLIADLARGAGLSETARTVLLRIDRLVDENSDALHATLSNLQVFTEALSRNAGRVDAILKGLEHMTGGGAAKPPSPMYDLAAPTSFAPFKKLETSLTIAEPTAVVMYDGQHPLLKSKDGGFTPFEDAQWSDSLVKLVQAKLLQTFDNAELFASVSRPVDGVAPENQLLVDIRSFCVSGSDPPSADVAIGAKLISADGKIVAAREFHRSAPAASVAAPDAVSALSAAFDGVETDLVAWTSEAL
jgi:phospholipid/cholesterol/gamma-HCH transport system substrate-binding protein